jgi:hypothetical protein
MPSSKTTTWSSTVLPNKATAFACLYKMPEDQPVRYNALISVISMVSATALLEIARVTPDFMVLIARSSLTGALT